MAPGLLRIGVRRTLGNGIGNVGKWTVAAALAVAMVWALFQGGNAGDLPANLWEAGMDSAEFGPAAQVLTWDNGWQDVPAGPRENVPWNSVCNRREIMIK